MNAGRHAKAMLRAVVPARLVAWSGPRRRNRARRRVALTFDDGPTALTRDYLSVLARHDAKATFFVVGELCSRHPDLLAEVARSGHELAGHGYTHRRFTELSPRELGDELSRTQALLPERCPRPLVRPPYGAVSLSSTMTCARAGFTVVLWSRDSGDWRSNHPQEVSRAVDATLEPGAIVLLHEGQRWTLDALPEILTNLRKAGHELCTVGELLGD
jgi:peptidoglycan/xylan/chitin deacetylase (PgdA/CDA1 family)